MNYDDDEYDDEDARRRRSVTPLSIADIFLKKKHTGDNPMILHGDDSNLACNCFRCVYMLYGVCMYVCTWSSTTVLFFLSYTYMVSKGKSRLP